ncbi:cysteine hydrolase family protein [Herbiconiux ginsengi]|uniref:Nicotinamidase-related amidase n=1 Tax=Herbiconiux ginsengi TaxID=381665 RepID=A0A1H3TI38_9MICO|nr:cysteine hydrolase [Herbiconiux ginsengi]SDZ49538.1 Nicotinamidase-related amidase [Herbiconiux ginsengi]
MSTELIWPTQVTEWDPSPELKPVGNVVLVVIDLHTQGPDTINAAGLATRQDRNERAAELVAAFRAKSAPVVFVHEVHNSTLIDFGRELDNDGQPYAVEGAAGTEIFSGLAPTDDEYTIIKRRHSAFFGTELDIVLRGYLAETIILVGDRTDAAIHYTAVDAHQHDYRIRVISDLVIGSDEDLHDAALRAIKYLQRDALVSTDAVTNWLDTLPPLQS